MISALYRRVLVFFLELEIRVLGAQNKESISNYLLLRLRRFPFWAAGHWRYAQLAFESGLIAQAHASCQAALILKVHPTQKDQVENLLRKCEQALAKI